MGTQIEEITIPDTVVVMEHYVFQDCKALRHIYFQKKSRLTTVGGECFRGSGLEDLTLPETLSEVGH